MPQSIGPAARVTRRLAAAPLVLALALAVSTTASARHIVISDDDGLSSNVVAHYRAQKDDGHDVVVAVPCTNPSGMGAAMTIGGALPPLTAGCRSGAASAGDPGAGPMTRADLPKGDFYYVSGTPVMATYYGIDVAAAKRWGRAPDLVLSGPNEGQNVGPMILGSGTVSNARMAAYRGVPAVALSAGFASMGDDRPGRPQSTEVAARTLELVRLLDRAAGAGPMLPPGVALNVNFPDARVATAPWQLARVGTYDAYRGRFVENMSRATPAEQALMTTPAEPRPGITFERITGKPRPDQLGDEAVVMGKAIAISVLADGETVPAATRARLNRTLAQLTTRK